MSLNVPKMRTEQVDILDNLWYILWSTKVDFLYPMDSAIKKNEQQATVLKVASGVLVILLFSYAVMPVTVEALPLVDVVPGLGTMLISRKTPQNRLPLANAATREMSAQETLLRVCERRGYDVSCGKALLGMMWKESLYDGTAIGDRGKARGYFQIHYRLHGISVECAEDLVCSADWTLDYLEQNGYPRWRTYAIQCHNGCNAGNGYAASVLRHGNRMWHYDFDGTYALALR